MDYNGAFHDRSLDGHPVGAGGIAAQPRRRAFGTAAMRQDHLGAPIRAGSFPHNFDLEDPQDLGRLTETVILEGFRLADLGATARALAVSEASVRRYLNLLSGVFMLRQLQPWFENLSKRQVKAPKVYVRDSGLLHALLGIGDRRGLERHPKVGASWESYAVEEVLKALRPDEAYFWATHQGAELDLLLFQEGRRVGIECKRMNAPTLTPSMRTALKDLGLDRLLVVYPGQRRYTLAPRVEVVPLEELVGQRK